MPRSPLKTSPSPRRARDRIAQIEHLLEELSRLTETIPPKGYDPRKGPAKTPALRIGGEPVPSLADRLTLARFMLAVRRARTRFFPEGFFGEPAWDILLDLYVAHCEARAVTVSSAAIGAGVPQTTGLRWVTMLTDTGRVCRKPSKSDGRMVFVSLTESARETIEAYLDWVIANSIVGAEPSSSSSSPSA
jgi:DNA-binding MarR family transcriptional regulator